MSHPGLYGGEVADPAGRTPIQGRPFQGAPSGKGGTGMDAANAHCGDSISMTYLESSTGCPIQPLRASQQVAGWQSVGQRFPVQ